MDEFGFEAITAACRNSPAVKALLVSLGFGVSALSLAVVILWRAFLALQDRLVAALQAGTAAQAAGATSLVHLVKELDHRRS